MQWNFPGRAAQLPLEEFASEPFQEALAAFLEQASMESLYSLQASTRKAQAVVSEIRDTTDPALITQMLMPLLEAIGSHFQAPGLQKRVKDEVNIEGGATVPWRRLPFWLILRVAAQRHLCLALGNEQGRVGYKVLICIVLADLLKESAGRLRPELVSRLRAKLCCRMAKLEMEREAIRSTDDEICESLLSQAIPIVKTAVEEATTQIETAWKSFKEVTTRSVPKLPLHAPQYALDLSLPNSGAYLDGLLSSQPLHQQRFLSADLPQPLDESIRQTQAFTDNIFRLASMEMDIDGDRENYPSTSGAQRNATRCVQLAQQINKVFAEVGTKYYSDPEQMSATILSLFTLWVRLDKCAVAACPLLAEYRPAFRPQLLDTLQLPSLSSMRCLQDIQIYLDQRHSRCQYGTIFDALDKGCFAVNYVSRSAEMQSLGELIQAASDRACAHKEAEWKRACEEYDRHTEKILDGVCCCSWSGGQRVVRGCSKCFHWRSRNRMKIETQEAFLPDKNPSRAVVIFELSVPQYLAAYRDATWKIVSVLAHPSHRSMSSKPVIQLKECAPLREYMSAQADGISLASTIKCFAQTHYKFQGGKVPRSRVILPFAARFELYDDTAKLWAKDLCEPLTFYHLCGVHIPKGLVTTILPAKAHPPPVVDGPSSYEIQTNQTECPSEVSVHEFSAYQKLLAGDARRWPNILVEMDSSNINFSSEDTMRLLCQLSVQAGSRLTGSREVLRTAHIAFKEPAFLKQLIQTIEKRLCAIQDNWREHHCMELLITLSLRLFTLSTGSVRTHAEALVEAARDATLGWTTRLRKEMHAATDGDAAQQISMYGFRAAMLCRRTLAVYVELDQPVSAKALVSWVQASIALQENLLTNIDGLPQELKNMMARDAKMAYYIQSLLSTAVRSHPDSVNAGISRTWSDSPADVNASFSAWNFLPPPYDRWIVATMSESRRSYIYKQTVHYNIIEGHLLIDGKLCGKLPLEISNSETVKELFGKKHLLAYPSSQPGMTHRLANHIFYQQIHFGIRNGQVVIRACGNDLLEYIPRQVFAGQGKCIDLPSELVEKCFHWINLDTGRLEIRRMPNIWKKRQRDWEVDVPGRRAYRGAVNLVDPQSNVFLQVAHILQHFERPEKLTVYQPQRGKLRVELRHLDLSLRVNEDGLLECQQLKAEIDPNQDAGTWYGLESKIVLRDITTKKRSIIVPLGNFRSEWHDKHVKVYVQDAVGYGLYRIDHILGRIFCPPEPRILYTKALCHALTSFCLPDDLTGRTGTEEAFEILRSGAAQPWLPLDKVTHPILKGLEALSPRREYYPPNIKRLQKVAWNNHMTTTIQHDGYAPLVQEIMNRSNRLNKFASTSMTEFVFEEVTHLHHRGEVHRRLYERPALDIEAGVMPDMVYIPRDCNASSRAANVYGVARLLKMRRPSFQMNAKLAPILESWQIIGGFHSDRDSSCGKRPIINQIEDPINEQWGDLVEFCRFEDKKVTVLFRLSLLAFHSQADMDIIRSLVAFASFNELKSLNPPPYSSFVQFKSRTKPPATLLENLLAKTYPSFKPFTRIRGLSNLLRDQAGRNAEQHKDFCEEEGVRLISHILEQWPTPADGLCTESFISKVIDVPTMLDAIKPEWERRRQNKELAFYIDQVQKVLDLRKSPTDAATPVQWTEENPSFSRRRHHRPIPSVATSLVVKACPRLVKLDADISFREAEAIIPHDKIPDLFATKAPSKEATELRGILKNFAQSSDLLRQQYSLDLLRSLTAFQEKDRVDGKVPAMTVDVARACLNQARERTSLYLKHVSAALAAGDVRFEWIRAGRIWPCTSPAEVLALLRSISSYNFGPGMKEGLVQYGQAITNLQLFERIHHALLRDDKRALTEELKNPGHENWSPLEQPDWLLLEIDSGFLIRAEQVDVAREIVAPRSGNNSVLQMNMGKGKFTYLSGSQSRIAKWVTNNIFVLAGKTSCIIPMVITALADGNSLSRAIVPKALLMQTAQTAQSRLGGLVGRSISHVPFSRKTSTTTEMLNLYADLHREARGLRGLILTSHEHVLSYKLGGWQHLADNKLDAAGSMIGFQNWLDEHCRDVLDECDFTLSVKTQLNYPSGAEMAVDGHPFRWQVAEDLLALAANHFSILRRKLPASIEVWERLGSFPMVRFLKSDAEDALQDRIIDDICSGRTAFLRPVNRTFLNYKKAIRRVLSEKTFDGQLFQQATEAFINPQTASKVLLVVRGLLINKILLLCLNKRWNVQYGLHPDRHPVAVPFEAKGTPSEQSEFGHPDVAIIFTCLAFYYTGLNFNQFCQGLQHILQSDDPAAQYEGWISGCTSLPEALYHWNVINIGDTTQMDDLWKRVCRDSVVINHYLNHFVFPVHAKQFDVKLQASAWDIPLFSKERQQQRGARTTGFSGTNDIRTMLPLTIRQDDLPSLQQTSAEVLSYLLQPRNRPYKVIRNANGRRATERDFLQQMFDAKIRILIDAGAYILEMDNITLAHTWLMIDHEAKAAIYFGSDNQAWVHYRGDTKNDAPLLATPFADDLSECVVYLDQAHTRGIDLRFPLYARGALTLALKQTKDYTMQG